MIVQKKITRVIAATLNCKMIKAKTPPQAKNLVYIRLTTVRLDTSAQSKTPKGTVPSNEPINGI